MHFRSIIGVILAGCFIRLAVIASQNREITRNSDKI